MSLRSALLPRPVDFLVKGVLSFVLGVGVALAEGYLAHQPDMLYTEGFRGVLGFHAPIHQMSPVVLVLAWFFIQSFLVEQAKYTWNDIRDHQRDQEIPLNRHRPLAQRPITRSTWIMLGLRWGGGLALAFLLDRGLFTIVLYLSLLQVIYEFGAKPASGRYPTLVLFVAAGAGTLRFFGGAMAVGAESASVRLWFYGLSIFALGIVGVAAIWRGEANYCFERGTSLPKPHSAYFRRRGKAWMWAGATVVVASVMILIVDALVPRNLSTLPTSALPWGPDSSPGGPNWMLATIPTLYLALLAVMYGIYLSRPYAAIARVEPGTPASEQRTETAMSGKMGSVQ